MGRRSKSPTPRKGARPAKKLAAKATPTAMSSSLSNAALLAVWFTTSIYFNYLTPEFNKYLSAKTDITMVELLSASAYGVVLLSLGGLPLLPPRKLARPMALVGFCHLWACKLFIMAVCGDTMAVCGDTMPSSPSLSRRPE